MALSRGVYGIGGQVFDGLGARQSGVIRLSEAPALPGAHNAQNIAAAYAACRGLGLTAEQIAAGVRSFPGLAHRLERAGEVAGVRFINDSKATNADSAARALACYQRIQWIAGGIGKAGGIAGLAVHFPRIAHAWLIGRDAEIFAATLALHGVAHRVVGTLEAAVDSAAAAARAGETVLLSPAAASFDQFANFEARGDRFRALVAKLANGKAA
jgi:UDP-N-acetylmuramoylalanine--D-glutamate ligase